jgi:hypothetical protein
MIVDMRTYTVRPGTLRRQLALYAEHGLLVQQRYLGQPFPSLLGDVGDVNRCVHLWAYDDAADRARRHAAMQADPERQAHLKRTAAAGYLISRNNRLMCPEEFAPLQRSGAGR